MSEHNYSIFEVVVTHYDSEMKKKTIVFGPEAILARDQDVARMIAVQQLEHSYDINSLEVLARAF
jgi:hypothetical protein